MDSGLELLFSADGDFFTTELVAAASPVVELAACDNSIKKTNDVANDQKGHSGNTSKQEIRKCKSTGKLIRAALFCFFGSGRWGPHLFSSGVRD